MRDHKFVLIVAGFIVAIVALPLIPLPPAVWQSLPGREIIVQIDEALGSGPLWRPMTMTPSHTLNALHFLALPGALLLLLTQLEYREIAGLLPVVAIMLGISVGIGYLQATGMPLDFYQIDNPVAGLFANRNHQGLAIACFLPVVAMLATRESKNLTRFARRRRHFLAVAVGLATIPLIFVTGSRAGLVLTAGGFIVAAFIWQSSVHSSPSRGKALLALSAIVIGIIGLVAAVLVGSDRNLAIQRLIAKDMSNELRVPVWRTTRELVGQYMPLGSGPGSFVEVFQIAEENDQLLPRYVNHAHNDFLEIALTSGLPGMLLAFVALIAFVICAWRVRGAKGQAREIRRYRWLGLGLIGLCAAASAVDYPLRTPALACLFVFAVFLAGDGRAPKGTQPRTAV
jgi:O-antigen ligase